MRIPTNYNREIAISHEKAFSRNGEEVANTTTNRECSVCVLMVRPSCFGELLSAICLIRSIWPFMNNSSKSDATSLSPHARMNKASFFASISNTQAHILPLGVLYIVSAEYAAAFIEVKRQVLQSTHSRRRKKWK